MSKGTTATTEQTMSQPNEVIHYEMTDTATGETEIGFAILINEDTDLDALLNSNPFADADEYEGRFGIED